MLIGCIVAPVAAQAPRGDPVALAIRNEAGGKLKEAYRQRGYWPLWVHTAKSSPPAERLLDLLDTADIDGLDPGDYAPDRLRRLLREADTPAKLAAVDLKLSRAFANYVRDMRRAPAQPIRYLDKELEPSKPSDEAILRAAALAPSLGDYVGSVGWMSPAYARLRSAIVDYRARWGKLPGVAVSGGAVLKQGAKGPRVAQLRERLGLDPGSHFDKPLAARLAAFQAAHGLSASGALDPATVAALDRSPRETERLLRLNLDRARVLPSAATKYILVDAASARLFLYRDGHEDGSMKVVVGKPETQTPMLAGVLRYAIFNPYWNVPEDLVQNKIAARFLSDPAGSAKQYEVLSDFSAKAVILDPATIDWRAVQDGRNIPRVRQRPGAGNAMGRMKFMFPNDLGIYLHDTNEKQLMAKSVRQFSNGCVRLEDAPRLAKWLFGTLPTVTAGKPEQDVALPRGVPVYLTYFTAAPTAKGVAFLDDAYGRDGRKDERMAAR